MRNNDTYPVETTYLQCKILMNYFHLRLSKIQTIEVPAREPVTECPTTWLTFKVRVKESIITSIVREVRAFIVPPNRTYVLVARTLFEGML